MPQKYLASCDRVWTIRPFLYKPIIVMSKHENQKSTQGGDHRPDQQACKEILKDVLFNISCGTPAAEMFEILERLLITYMASDVIEADDRKERDHIVAAYIDIKRIIRGLDTYNKMCKFTESNPS